jgi:hypothetical protein
MFNFLRRIVCVDASAYISFSCALSIAPPLFSQSSVSSSGNHNNNNNLRNSHIILSTFNNES